MGPNMDVADSLKREIGRAVRSLARSPGFTLIVIVTLALGIGATTAIFTMQHGSGFPLGNVRMMDDIVVRQSVQFARVGIVTGIASSPTMTRPR